MDYDNAELHNACRVYNNETVNGGGIYYQRGEFFNTNYVYNNTASNNGGGVYVNVGTNKVLQGLVIGSSSTYATSPPVTHLGNKAVLGGGVYTVAHSYADNITLENCEIIYNQLKSGGTDPIDKGGGLYMSETKYETTRNYAVKLTGGTIIGDNRAKDGGGVYVPNNSDNDCQLTLKLINTTLCNNIATQYGGGIYNDKQIVTSENNVSTITFHGNRAVEGDGGGIYNKGQVLLIGTTNQHIFTENRARSGGGIYNWGTSTCSLKNCQIGQSGKGNVAATAGGGIFVESGATTTLRPGVITFEGNHANNGGGLYNKGTVTQEDGCILTFDHNIADMNGGGVYHSGTPLTLTEAIFKNNEATMNGGGIYTEKACILNNCTIGEDSEPNHAKNGGGIYMNGEELTIQGGSVSHNTATNNGGGIYLEQENTFVNNNCRIQNNVASNNGGGIYVQQKIDGIKHGDYKFSALTVIGPDNDTIGTLDTSSGKIIATSTGEELAVDVLIQEYPNGFSSTIGMQTFYAEGQINDYANLTVEVGFSYTTYFEVYGETVVENSEWYTNANDCKFILRFKQTDGGVDYYLDLECGITYVVFEEDDGTVYHYYEYWNSLVIPAETIPLPAILTLNGSTVGGETGKGNEATNGDGGGIYIGKKATVIMTSDGSSTAYPNGIRNDVTHNKASIRGGGVYKDGTLQVEGWVVITDNEAGVSPGKVPENVYIPPGSDDEQTILIIGELVCESSIGVTKTKKWMEEGANEVNATSNVASPQYGNQGEHIYERDLFFKQVNTPIAQVSSTGEELWAEDAFYKRIYFDDKGYYRVWSFDFNNQNLGDDYSDQKDYFIETWRSFAASDFATANQIEDAPEFALLAKKVNDGNSFNQSAFQQTTTIDLAAHHWEPIGYTFCGECEPEHRPFAGTYNGNGHFILNVVSLLPEKEMGLFGYVTGTVKHTFTVGDQFYNTHDHAYTNHSSCTANLGALVGNTTGTIDGCEAANYLLHVHYQDNDGTIAAGGIAGNVGAGEVRNCFTSHINFYEDYGTFQDCGGLVGNIASGSKVKNCYTKVNSETAPVNYAALVGNNDGEFENAYTSATTGVIVGSGTAGTNVYSAGASGATATYTPAIGADHLGYMCIDNGVPYSTCGLTAEQKRNLIEGKDYFKFNNANGNEVELIPLYRLLNLNAKALNNNSDNYIPYTEWARPALAYYDGLGESAGTTGSIKRPINLDLPLLMLNNYDDSPYIGQGGFRSVGTYGGIADILQ